MATGPCCRGVVQTDERLCVVWRIHVAHALSERGVERSVPVSWPMVVEGPGATSFMVV